ncbi:GNAT family N-acetyltransferase [Vibrio profundi]|uniref:GNAT family N-acetyltransferase n=1 Tax=Vibrio profundi TaxID=1774960 RepID=UPI003735524A
MFKIETNRLILRDFHTGDANAYVQLTQDKKYQRFYSEEDCTAEKSLALVQMFTEQANESPRSKFQLAITVKETGQVIGTCGIRLEGNQQASMGCGVARSAQGTGYALEAASALIEFGFNSLHCHRIYAETIADNKAAIALCRHLGMREEAIFKEHRYFKDKWWDTAIYAFLKSEWEQNLAD